nr:methyl-accepting chemotaxis protein [Marinitoga lauensis]
MKTFVDDKGFYDVFIVGTDGDVTYTYFKEKDFATNLLKGKWKNTNLAKLFRILQNSNDDKVHYVDFEPYDPSSGSPAAFAGTPLKKDNKTIGYLIVQLPINKIDYILQERTGMGESGETYVVGPDYLMRSNSRFEENTILKRKVETKSVREALKGNTGWDIINNYRGIKVISAYLPFEYNELKWALIGEIDYSEANDSIKKLVKTSIIILVIILVLSIITSILFTNKLVNPLKEAVKVFEKVSNGDLTVKLEIKGKDEIAILAKSLNKTIDNLKRSMENIVEISKKLNDSSTDLATISEENNVNIEKISSQSEIIEENTEVLSSSIEQVSSGVEEIAANSQDISKSAQEMLNSSEETSQFAIEGQQGMENIVNSIHNVSEKTKNVEIIVSELANKAQNIGEILETIGSITEQTNLLALNAAIEAARAGKPEKVLQ